MFASQNSHTITVTLTVAEIDASCAFAKRIEDANRKNRRSNKQGLKVSAAESLKMRESGMMGEAALAKALGMPSTRIADQWRAKPDVGVYDVATTKLERGSLIFVPRDHLLMRKVLVIDCFPAFHICGWYLCEDARVPNPSGGPNSFWRTERAQGGAWYVPQSLLKPIPELQR